MAPGILTDESSDNGYHDLPINSKSQHREPLELTGALDGLKYEETTPAIGREYIDVNIVDDILTSEDRIRDLAITIAQRGAVFFRAQDNLTDDLQKEFVHRMGLLSGKPADSSLHVHPVLNSTSEFGVKDDQISTISSLARKKMFRHEERDNDKNKYDSAIWHSDIQFEHNPADYTSLRLTQLPSTGGDTLWASGYEIYDRFSKPYQRFFEGLTATFIGAGFLKAAERDPERVKIHTKPRGSPNNVGGDLKAVHPVVRTNPVTGWKSIFTVGPFAHYINELSHRESRELLEKFNRVVLDNHDLTTRFKWRNPNDIAIWDNRSAFHCATFDYDGLGERFGHRAVGIGEKPYLDPNSQSRSEALGLI